MGDRQGVCPACESRRFEHPYECRCRGLRAIEVPSDPPEPEPAQASEGAELAACQCGAVCVCSSLTKDAICQRCRDGGHLVRGLLRRAGPAVDTDDHRSALQDALECFQLALHTHSDDSTDAEKLAIQAHAKALLKVKPSGVEGRQPYRFGGD